MFLRLLSSLICNAQKLIKKYYGYNIKLIKKNKKKSNNILTDTSKELNLTFTYKHGMIRGQLYKRACIQMYVAYPDYIRVRLIT